MNFKTTKKTVKKPKASSPNKKIAWEFPKIFRFITESGFYKWILASINVCLTYLNSRTRLKKLATLTAVLFVSLLVIITIFGFVSSYENFQNFRVLDMKRQGIEESIKLWQSIAEKYPGYKDAYFKIASMEYQLGDYQQAEINVEKALVLDPNFKDAITLEKLINLNY